MKEESLDKLRKRIDALDRQMVALLNERADTAQKIGAAKQGTAVYRPTREKQVLKNVTEINAGRLSDDALTAIYSEIIAACRNIQRPLRVACLGPEGTYSEEAARKQCGSTSEYLLCPSIDEAVRATEAGRTDVAVVPVENSTEGAINRTLDLLLQTSLIICSEIYLPIHHQLLSHATAAKEINEVIAHPQALAQCRTWLNEHLPHAKQTVASSNAEAARQAKDRSAAAAIAGKRAVTIYDLPILASNIEDDPNNTTRFLLLGTAESLPTGNDKTSLICSTADRPGALYGVLSILAEQGINIVKLESRPAANALWDYVFYIDIGGHKEDEHVAKALTLLNEQVVFVKVAGSYPKGA